MQSRYFTHAALLIATAIGAVAITGCNKQPNPVPTSGTAEAPPIAALPLTAAAPPPSQPAPLASELPAPPRPISYAPAPRNERYRYIDNAYSMSDAFAATPPDYTVDYEGSRPWIWRARNGAYRIVERLPRGERMYYYGPGDDQPFLVRDPDYSYAYDRGQLVGVYGPDGSDLDASMAARRADEAARYYERSRQLYRAAQYQRRQAAHAREWAERWNDIRDDHRAWQEEQYRNTDWRAWHDAHEAAESEQWRQERDQRVAYASAIGLPLSWSAPLPNPDQIVRRQTAYFTKPPIPRQETPSSPAPAPTTLAQHEQRTAPPIVNGPAVEANSASKVQSVKAGAQVNSAQLAAAQQAAAAAKQKEAAAAQAKAAEAAQAQQTAAAAKQKEAAAAQAKAAQAAQAQRAADEAKQKEAAASRVKAAQAMAAQRAAAQARQSDAVAAQQKAAEAARSQKLAAEASARETLAARAKLEQASQAQRAAAEAQRKQVAAAQEKAAQSANAEKAAAEAKQHEAAAAKAKGEEAAHAQKPATAAPSPKAAAPQVKDVPKNGSKGRHAAKDDQEQARPQ